MKKKSSVFSLCVCAMMAAVICILGPMAIPVGPVPITLCTLGIYLAVCLLGPGWGTVSVLIYILLGAFGLPVFSAYSGGLGKLVGPTGGYIVGYLILAPVSGWFAAWGQAAPVSRKRKTSSGRFAAAKPYVWSIIGMILGTIVLYAFGTAWFMFQMQCSFRYALTVCVLPFLVPDILKMLAAALIGTTVRRQLIRAHLLPARGKQRSGSPEESPPEN